MTAPNTPLSIPTSPRSATLSRLPVPAKKLLLFLYWLAYDARDFIAEVIGWLPSNRVRVSLWRMLGVKIGRHVGIHRGCRFYLPSRIHIGDHCVILRETLLHYNAMDADPFQLIVARRELVDGGHQYLEALRRFADGMTEATALARGVTLQEMP